MDMQLHEQEAEIEQNIFRSVNQMEYIQKIYIRLLQSYTIKRNA